MRISEVSRQCDVPVDTLRYYERIGLLPPIDRSDSGIRDYSDLDVRRINFIKCMRNAGLPVKVLIRYYELVQQGDETIADRKAILVEEKENIKVQMAELQETLDLLDYKISHYESLVLKAESAFADTDD